MLKRNSGLIAVAILAVACANTAEQPGASPESLWMKARPALESITAAGILDRTKVLASDEFEGRAPGSKGEELTVAYLTDQFQRVGLQPGNPDGTWVQDVPLVGFTTTPITTIVAGGKTIDLKFPSDLVVVSRHIVPRIDVDNSDIVFVGYGVVAKEYGWDDFKDVDVRGKTIMMLINDPAVPDPNDPSRLDANIFKGRAMTYYGRWSYKYEEAMRKGAAAAIIVHETGPAGYPYEVISGSWSRENFDIKSPGGNLDRPKAEAWIRVEKARELVSAAGQDFDELKRAAIRKDFRPVALNAKATFHMTNALREVQSKNVIGKLEGKKKDEYIIYTAHWDHLGRDPNLAGDQIYNGAVDNASGVAGITEIAEAFSKLPEKPERTILFLAVTAEEKGLLGAKHYATAPLYPLNKTVANINIDGLATWGRTKDIIIVGYGNTDLDEVLAGVTAKQNRTISQDAEPEKGFFYRSDHFEFAKQGVPALYTHRSANTVDHPVEWGVKMRDAYTANNYHKPSDEVNTSWDMAGAVEDMQAMFMVGYIVAESDAWPTWKPGTEFKAKREASLK